MSLNKFRLYYTRFLAVVYFVMFYHLRKFVRKDIFLVGVFFVLAGLIVRLMAQSTLKKNKELSTEGLYALTRNPLYFGSSFILLGFILFTITEKIFWWQVLFWTVSVFSLAAIYLKKIKEEENSLRKIFPEYEKWAEKVPVFFPKIRKTKIKIKFRQWVKNREHKLASGLAIIIFLMAAILRGGK